MKRGLWVVDGRIVESGPHIYLTIIFLVQSSKIGTKKILPRIKSICHISSKRNDISLKRIDSLRDLIVILIYEINKRLIVILNIRYACTLLTSGGNTSASGCNLNTSGCKISTSSC
jgi:hypothetical protein